MWASELEADGEQRAAYRIGGEHLAASSEERAVGEARQEALLSHPANFNLRAGLIASAKANAAGKKRRRGIVELLDQALAHAKPGALLDYGTSADGSCLFHALAAGGLLDDIPASFVIIP